MTHYIKSNKTFILSIMITLFISCVEKKPQPAQDNPYENKQIDVKVFSNDTTADSAIKGFGYNIYMQQTLYVHQPNIPAVSGNRGFKSEADAEKTAMLTVYKIRNNIMPPSLSVKELDSLGVTKE